MKWDKRFIKLAAQIIQAGIKRIVTVKPSEDALSRWKDDFDIANEMYKEAGVELHEITAETDGAVIVKPVKDYSDQRETLKRLEPGTLRDMIVDLWQALDCVNHDLEQTERELYLRLDAEEKRSERFRDALDRIGNILATVPALTLDPKDESDLANSQGALFDIGVIREQALSV